MTTTAATEQLKALFEGIRDERKMYANTATRIGNAFLSLLSYLMDAPFIRKDREDETAFLLKLLKGAVIGESNNITLNPDGSIKCDRIVVDGSAIFNELVFNHQNVLEGDTYFTDKGIIEKVERINVTQYRLTFRKQYDNDHVTFHVNDILRSSTNNLDTDRTYKTSWMRVEAINLTDNTCFVTMFNDTDVPGGKNYPPLETARVIRWGNAIDVERQQTFYISAVDGTFLFLQGVDSPITNDKNISAFLGIPPEMECLKDLPINARQPYIYARGLIVQDMIRIDYQGLPVVTYVDRGQWAEGANYYNQAQNPMTGEYETSDVWYNGCKYRCCKNLTKTTPAWNNTDWALIEGNVPYVVSVSRSGWLRNGIGSITLTATVIRGDTDITGDLYPSQFSWRRESSDAEKDAAWNRRHKDVGNVITLTAEDVMGSAVFTCDLESE